jgi:dTDP-glucose pyrophosphorylase
MTMAGLGARFKDAGYTQEKYEIVFHGKPLFDWALESLSAFRDFEFIFIARDSPHVKEFILERTDLLGFRKIKIKTLTHLTRGQAETAALASEFFEPDDSMIIYNTDTHVKPGTLRPEQIKGNGWVPVFSASGDKWSFVEADVDGTVKRTTEKVRVSDYCSIGLYYFDSFQKFWKLVEICKQATLTKQRNGTLRRFTTNSSDWGMKYTSMRFRRNRLWFWELLRI